MDECEACEEHFGSTEWVLTNDEPELAELGPQLLTSRRATLPEATPSDLPASIINIQNAATLPAPSGFTDTLNAVTNANAFRDMAGLAGTQANARAAMETAADLAAKFGSEAASIYKAQLAASIAKNKMSAVDKAYQKGNLDDAERKSQTKKALDEMNMSDVIPLTIEDVKEIIDTAGANRADVSISRPSGEKVEARTLPQALGNAPATWVDLDGNTASMRTFSPDINDKSGTSRLQAAVSNAPPGAKFQWTVHPPNKLRFSHPNAGATDIIAGESGVTTVSFQVLDTSGNSLRIGHVWVGVPKFIVVREFAGPAYVSHRGGVANSHLFDTALSEFHLSAQKAAVLQTAKLVCDYLLRRANVRTIWDLAPFGEVLPNQFQPGGFAVSHLKPARDRGLRAHNSLQPP